MIPLVVLGVVLALLPERQRPPSRRARAKPFDELAYKNSLLRAGHDHQWRLWKHFNRPAYGALALIPFSQLRLKGRYRICTKNFCIYGTPECDGPHTECLKFMQMVELRSLRYIPGPDSHHTTGGYEGEVWYIPPTLPKYERGYFFVPLIFGHTPEALSPFASEGG